MPKIPEGYHTVTPSLVLNGAKEAIKLYTKAFNAKEEFCMEDPKGTGMVMHAVLQIGNSKIFIADVMPGCGDGSATNSGFYLYMDDVDASFKQARDAGLSEYMPVTDMFWGDRIGAVKDKFGVIWNIATHTREVSPEELEEGARKFSSNAA